MDKIASLLLLLFAGFTCLAESMVLTGNAAAVGPDARGVANEAALRFVTDGEYATDPELLSTGSRPEGSCRALLDGGLGPWAETMAFHSWGHGLSYGTFVIDLGREYQLDRVAVWSVEDEQRSVESYEVLVSVDGERFFSMGSWKNPGNLKSPEMTGIPLVMDFENPVLGRYVEFRVAKNPGRFQMILAEAAVWGEVPLPGSDPAALLPENQRPRARVAVSGIEESAVRLDWSAFAAGVTGVKNWYVYRSEAEFGDITETGVELVDILPPERTAHLVYPLTPGTAQYWGVAAEYADGVYPYVTAARHQVPLPFQRDSFGDMLAINHFWGGGGARGVARPHADAWEQVALDMLAKTPYRQTRWWVAYPGIVEKLFENGIGLCSFPGDHAFRDGLSMGIYSYSAGNEPDISGRPMEEYNRHLREVYAKGKALSPLVTISAPTTGLEERSLVWLDNFYQAGMKDYFDVLDLHTYTKVAADFPVPAGYPPASPEALFTLIPKIREIMARHGDGDKSMISTEFGFTDSRTANPSGDITEARKAEFLIRGLIIHYVLDFRRVYVYSFWDEGEDFEYTEHFFGLMDYNMQVKPAYTASCVLGEMLGECVGFEPMPGAAMPDVGYNFHNPVSGRYVAVIWNGAAERGGEFAAAPGKVEIVSLYGERTAAQTDDAGNFRLRFGPAPVYIVSSEPVRLLRAVDAAPDAAAAVRPVTLEVPALAVAPRGEAVLPVEFTLANHSGAPVEVKAALETLDGGEITSKRIALAAGETAAANLPFAFGDRSMEELKLNIGYEGAYDSFYQEETVFVRRHPAAPGAAEVVWQGLDAPVVEIANDAVAVTVDPARGGRLLEFIDRRDGGNQVILDYAKAASLPSIPFAYAIWDTLRCEDPALTVGRDAPYQYQVASDRVTMRAGSGLELEKSYILGPGGRLTLALRVTNRTASPQVFSYYLHPEYTVGGSGDSVNDELVLPIGGRELVMPFWSGLGERAIDRVEAGWWRVADKASGVVLEQEFDLDEFINPRLWFGIGAYNLEMETRRIELAPGAAWTGELIWTLK